MQRNGVLHLEGGDKRCDQLKEYNDGRSTNRSVPIVSS